MQLSRLIDRQRERFRDCHAVAVLGRRVLRSVKQYRGSGLEALKISSKGNTEPFAEGSSLLMREREAAKSSRQLLSGHALVRSPGNARQEEICTSTFRPDPNLHRRRDTAPVGRVGCDEDLR